jgi:hypothetical protein
MGKSSLDIIPHIQFEISTTQTLSITPKIVYLAMVWAAIFASDLTYSSIL